MAISSPITASATVTNPPSPYLLSKGIPGPRPHPPATPQRQDRPRQGTQPSATAFLSQEVPPVHRPWLEYWLESLRRELALRNYSPDTHRNYLLSVRGFLLLHPGPPRRWTAEDLRTYLLGLRQDRTLSPTTVNLHHDALNFFFRNVAQHPDAVAGIPRLRETRSLPRVLGIPEAADMIASAKNPKHKLILSLAFGCGLRVSELAKLRIADLDFSRNVIRITSGGRLLFCQAHIEVFCKSVSWPSAAFIARCGCGLRGR